MTEPKNAKNKGPVESSKVGDEVDFSSWEEIQVGFAPYWAPEEGKSFMGFVVARDERDPEFMRYLVQALVDTPCHRGAKGESSDEAEAVLVKKNEFFTVSVYYSLAESFDFMLENFTAKGDPCPMRMTADKKVKTSTVGQKCWTWKMVVPPDYKKKYLALRDVARRAQIEAQSERKALEEVSAN